jgi:hypothetical protein
MPCGAARQQEMFGSIQCNPRIQKCTSDEVDFSQILEKLMGRLEANDLRTACGDSGKANLSTQKFYHFQWRVPRRPSAAPPTSKRSGGGKCESGPGNEIKINCDAAVDCLNNKMGIGVIARDHNGNAVVMLSASKEYISDPAMAEGSGWRAVESAWSLDLENIMLEGDSLEVVQALKENGSCWSLYIW